MPADGARPRPHAHIVGRGNESSSPGLSSPPSPHSPSNAITSLDRFDRHTPIVPSQHGYGDGGDGEGPERVLAKNPTVIKKPRKKRELKIKSEHANKSSTTTTTDGKEVITKVRKSRNPSGTTSSSTVGRKKKVVDATESRVGQGQPLPRHTKIATADPHPPPPSSLPPADFGVPATLVSKPQNGNHEVIARTSDSQPIMPLAPRSTSGQNYDPIRSSTIEPRSHSPRILYNVPPRSATPPRHPAPRYTSASASPSIASLIEAPIPTHANLYPLPPKHAMDTTAPSSPTAKRPRVSPPPPPPPPLLPAHVHHTLQPTPTYDDEPGSTAVPAVAIRNVAAGGIDSDVASSRALAPGNKSTVLVKKPSGAASTAPSSTSHSPKPSRHREPLVPSGNGLLSSAIFGGGQDGPVLEKNAPTVILHVPLHGTTNLVVNFAEMAEKKYGFHALHPRLAAQRDRLARVAAAGAALENAHRGRRSGSGISADEMSVDFSDGAADDSNVEMGGIVLHDREGNALRPSGSEGGIPKKVPKKRMMKEDQYDKDDPFVDDTELAWEEQAAASRDGFFVYSGPLVPEGEKIVVER